MSTSEVTVGAEERMRLCCVPYILEGDDPTGMFDVFKMSSKYDEHSVDDQRVRSMTKWS